MHRPTQRFPPLQLQAVRKVYPTGDDEVVALDHATLTIGHDEIVALVGPSGSGKTTLCSIAGGILSPTAGQVVVGGKDITEYSQKKLTDFRREHVGFVFQSVNLVPFLTARENLVVIDEIGQRTGAPARARRGSAPRGARPGRPSQPHAVRTLRWATPTRRHRPRPHERSRPGVVRQAHLPRSTPSLASK